MSHGASHIHLHAIQYKENENVSLFYLLLLRLCVFVRNSIDFLVLFLNYFSTLNWIHCVSRTEWLKKMRLHVNLGKLNAFKFPVMHICGFAVFFFEVGQFFAICDYYKWIPYEQVDVFIVKRNRILKQFLNTLTSQRNLFCFPFE